MPPTAGPLTRRFFQQLIYLPPVNSCSYASRMYRTAALSCHLDTVRINNLALNVYFRDGTQWSSYGMTPVLQPVKLTLSVAQDLKKFGQMDDLTIMLNYASLASKLAETTNNGTFSSLEELVDDVFHRSFSNFDQIQDMSVHVTKPKALLRGTGVSLSASQSRGKEMDERSFTLNDIEIPVVIGINQEERKRKQIVRLNIALSEPAGPSLVDYHSLSEEIYQLIDSSSYFTVEAFASSVAHRVLLQIQHQWSRVAVRVEKPNALALADSAEVEVTRTLEDYVQKDGMRPSDCVLNSYTETISPRSSGQALHKVALALGSNLGDRFANIEMALRLLETPQPFLDREAFTESAQLVVVDTSFLYETAPMYVTDQPSFINCACMIETNLSSTVLLKVLKNIETTVGRVPSIRNGPRAVDLDVLFYDDEVIDTREPGERSSLGNLDGHLLVPHPRIAEREFVLRPLNDMVPDYIVPSLHRPVKVLLDHLMNSQGTDAPVMHKVVPFPKYPFIASPPTSPIFPMHLPLVPPTATYWKYSVDGGRFPKTHIMATLNATPDSFSDGSVNNTLPMALKYASASVTNGADIVDVGGYSTRPHAEYVSPADETSRVVPVIQSIRNSGGHESTILVSIDTFRADVAKAAVLAGANCINDVHGFTGPEYPLTRSSAENFLKMRNVARELAVPVILMHSRGEASANKNYSLYDYAGKPSAVVEGVRVELGAKVDAVVKGKGGVRRWFVILDPGVGFSKTLEGNLEVLRNASYITSSAPRFGTRNPLAGFPQLIGVSRKSFLGTILEAPDGNYEGRLTGPKERGWATAAAVACAVQQKALVVRVHDVIEMGDVARVSSALWSN